MKSLPYHFVEALWNRAKTTLGELMGKYPNPTIIKPGQRTRHHVIRRKQMKYPDQTFVVFEKENLFIAVREDGTPVTAMYLDGRWGY